MTDINEEIVSIRSEVDRLREALADNDLYVKTWSDNYDAAQDENTRLHAENERLREAIMHIHDTLYETRTMPANRVGYEIEWCIDHARATFKGDSDG